MYSFGLQPSNPQPSGTVNMSRIDNAQFSIPKPDYKVVKQRIYNGLCPISMRNIKPREYYIHCKYCQHNFVAKEIEYFGIEKCPICESPDYFDEIRVNVDDNFVIFEKRPNIHRKGYLYAYASNYNILQYANGLAEMRYT
jgi:hypothetical protein